MGSISSTLLLNATYEPLKVISWQRAVSMLYLGKVEVVRGYDRMIRSVRSRMQTPAVVRLVSYVRRRRLRISFSRRNVFLRDGNLCQYCAVRLPVKELTCDHVLPRSKGGAASWENMVTACGPCNRRKGNRTPEQARMRLRKLPTQPQHLPFMTTRFNADGTPGVWRDFLPRPKRL